MVISKESADNINDIMRLCFQMNSFSDNLAYYFDSSDLPQIGDIYHHRWAHYWPQLADVLSTALIQWGYKPTRKGLASNEDTYANVADAFADNERAMEEFCNAVRKGIEIADMSDSPDSRIFLENFLDSLRPYIHQARLWKTRAVMLNNDPNRFDDYFENYTLIPEL